MIGPDPSTSPLILASRPRLTFDSICIANLPTNHGDNEILAPPQSNTGVFPPSDPLEHSSEDTWDYAEDTPEPSAFGFRDGE